MLYAVTLAEADDHDRHDDDARQWRIDSFATLNTGCNYDCV